MGLEILLSRGNRLVPLLRVGGFANPKENLQGEKVLKVSEPLEPVQTWLFVLPCQWEQR